MSEFEQSDRHLPVMVEEVVEALAVRPGGRYVDGTLGEGGHSGRILVASGPEGLLLGIDRDRSSLERTRRRLAPFGDRVTLENRTFDETPVLLALHGWDSGADGVLLDLGMSSAQVDDPARGFSFAADGPLDMRMDTSAGPTAADLVATLSEQDLANTIYRYGDEHASRRIARAIVARRSARPIQTTGQLRDTLIGAGVRGRPGHDPATRTFQALRIAVNDEIGRLERFLDEGWEVLARGGRLAVITYHSLEDRAVKQAFRRWASDCVCPPVLPVCRCDWDAKVKRVTRRKRRPTEAEIAANPRSRSAGLRVVERI